MKQVKEKTTAVDQPQNRTERIKLLDGFSLDHLKNIQILLSQLQRSGIGRYPIVENEIKGLNNRKISIACTQISMVSYDVVSLFGLTPVGNYMERQFIVGDMFETVLGEVEQVLLKRTKKLVVKPTVIHLDFSDEVLKVYPKIKTVDDVDTGKMKLVGVGPNEVIIGRKNEQMFMLISNVIRYHNITQNIDELYSLLERTKKGSKKLVHKDNTSASHTEKKKHIFSIINEVNRTVRERADIKGLISRETKGLSNNEIKLLLNLKLGRIAG